MGMLRLWHRGMRLFLVCGLSLTALFALGDASTSVTAAPPQPDNPQSSNVSTRDPRQPGNHATAAGYYYSQRLTPNGKISAQARTNALKQAAAVPAAEGLPGAVGGKGQRPATSSVAPPSAVWQQLGPSPEDTLTLNQNQDYRFGNVSGRATAIVVGQHTGDIYLGTADGGIWKSTNAGTSWTALTDKQPSLAIGSLALDPADATDRTVYAGTGETNYAYPSGSNGDAYFGVGVLKTSDSGTTWSVLGQSVFGGYSANSIGIGVMVANGNTVYAGTTRGLYRSTDGATGWNKITVAAGGPNGRVTDIVLDGSNVYVVLSEAGGNVGYAGVYKSTTGGAGGYAPIVTNLPTATTWGRAQLAIAPSTPTTLYLAIATINGALLGIYKTINGGGSWAATTTQPPDYFDGGGGAQGDYDNTIAVDPADATLVYAGGVYVVASTNGGGTWTNVDNVYCGAFPCLGPTHPDQHAIAFGSSGSPRPLYIANDGGVWKTINGNAGTGTTWTDLNTNIATTQFYAGDAANNYAATPIVVGGAQDNGSSRSGVAALSAWSGILGGDGGYVAISKSDPNTIYADIRKGNCRRRRMATRGRRSTGQV